MLVLSTQSPCGFEDKAGKSCILLTSMYHVSSHPAGLLRGVLAPPPGLHYTWGCAVLLHTLIVQLTKTLLTSGDPYQARVKGITRGCHRHAHSVSVSSICRVIHTFVPSSVGGKTLAVLSPIRMMQQMVAHTVKEPISCSDLWRHKQNSSPH